VNKGSTVKRIGSAVFDETIKHHSEEKQRAARYQFFGSKQANGYEGDTEDIAYIPEATLNFNQ
jgi:hypothetical protein